MKALCTSLLAIAMTLVAVESAIAQDNEVGVPRPITEGYFDVGFVIVCVVSAEGPIIVLAEEAGIDGTLDVSVSGETSLTTLQNTEEDIAQSEADLRRRGRFDLSALTFTGNDPTLGDYTFTFDANRPASNSTIVANDPDRDFPATADIYANVSGTISGLSGAFTNSTECHMRSTNVNSIGAGQSEQYQFVDPVEFTNDDGSARFTIPAGATVTVN